LVGIVIILVDGAFVLYGKWELDSLPALQDLNERSKKSKVSRQRGSDAVSRSDAGQFRRRRESFCRSMYIGSAKTIFSDIPFYRYRKKKAVTMAARDSKGFRDVFKKLET